MSYYGYRQEDKGEQYVRQYPHLKEWVNQCVVCQDRGYKPSMPNPTNQDLKDSFRDRRDSHGYSFRNLRRYFYELELDQIGRCPMCR